MSELIKFNYSDVSDLNLDDFFVGYAEDIDIELVIYLLFIIVQGISRLWIPLFESLQTAVQHSDRWTVALQKQHYSGQTVQFSSSIWKASHHSSTVNKVP